jgi:hypothetical protein
VELALRAMGILRQSVSDIDRHTPEGRNRYVDALRVGAILVVVYGHWLLAVVSVRDGRLDGVNLLTLVPGTHWLTWLFQVMPVFFWVGGYANAAAWRSARDRGVGWADWVRGRARRLLRPVVPLVVLWVPVGAALAALGVPRSMIQFATQVAIVPVWFLATYLLVCAAVPLTHRLHERWGAGVVVALVALAVVVDVAHLAGVPVVGWTNFVWIWGAVHQVGYLWHDTDRAASGAEVTVRLPRGVAGAVALAAVGYLALVALTRLADYPVSMVGVDGATRSNNSPPSVALLALAAGQIGLALAVRRPAERLLQRPMVWALVVLCGSFVMTIYLWHQTAMIAVAAALVPTGILPRFEQVDTTWWLLRPLWWLACTLALAGLVALFGRFEHAGPPRPRSSAIRAGIGVVLATAGLGLLVFGGLHRPGTATGVPWVPLGLFVTGLGALGALRRPHRPQGLPAPGGAAEPVELSPPDATGR